MFGISQDAYLLMPFQTALAVNGVVEEPDLSISFTKCLGGLRWGPAASRG